MITGPFQIEISDQAEPLDFEALDQDERNALFRGVTHDPEKHGIFRILLSPVERTELPDWSERVRRKKGYELVDKVLVRIEPGHKQMSFLGMYPTTIAEDGTPEFDLAAGAEGEIVGMGKATLSLKGPIKNWFRRTGKQVVGQRTDKSVNWVYARRWISDGKQFQGEMLCVVPKSVGGRSRKLRCHASFKDKGGRAVEKISKDVRIP